MEPFVLLPISWDKRNSRHAVEPRLGPLTATPSGRDANGRVSLWRYDGTTDAGTDRLVVRPALSRGALPATGTREKNLPGLTRLAHEAHPKAAYSSVAEAHGAVYGQLWTATRPLVGGAGGPSGEGGVPRPGDTITLHCDAGYLHAFEHTLHPRPVQEGIPLRWFVFRVEGLDQA